MNKEGIPNSDSYSGGVASGGSSGGARNGVATGGHHHLHNYRQPSVATANFFEMLVEAQETSTNLADLMAKTMHAVAIGCAWQLYNNAHHIFIFCSHLTGEKNHNLCCVFLNKFYQKSILLLHLVKSSHHGAVGSASTWQTRGRGFEPVMMSNIFSGKYPGA